jgi:hypothetical protein
MRVYFIINLPFTPCRLSDQGMMFSYSVVPIAKGAQATEVKVLERLKSDLSANGP